MIDFIKYRYVSLIVSGILFVVSVIALLTLGLKLGIDFTGGSLIELTFTKGRPTVEDIQKAFVPLNLGEVSVQPTKQESVLLRMRFITEEEHQKILTTLRTTFDIASATSSMKAVVMTSSTGKASSTLTAMSKDTPAVYEDNIQTIGSSVSSSLRTRAVQGSLAIIIAIIVYIAYVFRKISRPVASWKYGISAVIALLHDIVITMGVFAFLGRYAGVEVGIPFVVALLTVFGYSVNDTIVVFDRIRETLMRKRVERFDQLVNVAINETIMRSINTTLIVLIPLFALFFLGGESIRYFAFALLIGVTSGAYSSIFVASPLVVLWEAYDRKRKAKV